MRAKQPNGRGIWPAIWMMPQDESTYGWWPASGEIDIYEGRGQNPTEVRFQTSFDSTIFLSFNQLYILEPIIARATIMTVLVVVVEI